VRTVAGPSGTALIEVDRTGMNRIVVVPGANGTVSPDDVAAALADIDDVAIVLTQGEVPLASIEAAMVVGKSKGARTILNPAPVLDYPVELLRAVDIVLPNEHEAAQLTGLDTSTLEGAQAAAAHLVALGVNCAIITRGGDGAIWATDESSGNVPAFPVTRARMEKVHGGARGPALAAALSAHTTVEGIPDQVLRQLLWEREHPIGSAALGLADYRAQWLGVRAPAFRPRGGRARHDGLAPARDVLADAVDLAAWPAPGRTGDLAALDEAAAIDAAACAITAYRCLHGTADSWARIGTVDGGRVLIPACPDLIERAVVNIARLADEGSIAMPLEVAGGAVGPAHSW
jgi:hypothetical protein